MKILHTSDWHLGRQFHNISLLDDQRIVLQQIVNIAQEQQVDVILIAGDVFDRSVPPASAVELLDEILHQILNKLSIPVIMIAGNHDGPERLGFAARQLSASGLHIFGKPENKPTPVVISDSHGPVQFFAVPYCDPAEVKAVFQVDIKTHQEAQELIVNSIKESMDTGLRTVIVNHLFLDGSSSSESERPLSIGGLDTVSADLLKEFHYTALGHLHGRQFKGSETIRYSGSILKYSFSEEHHQKSVTIVEMDEQGECSTEQIPLVAERDMRILEGSLADILEQGKQNPRNEDYLLVRLTDRHAILDVMNKLREVYPNVLHLERPGLMAAGEIKEMGQDQLKRGEFEMFEDFYQQVGGEPLSDPQKVILRSTLEKIKKGEGADA